MLDNPLFPRFRIKDSAFVPEGEIYVLNDRNHVVDFPENFKDLSMEEKLTFAMDNDLLLLMNKKWMQDEIDKANRRDFELDVDFVPDADPR